MDPMGFLMVLGSGDLLNFHIHPTQPADICPYARVRGKWMSSVNEQKGFLVGGWTNPSEKYYPPRKTNMEPENDGF